jgi:predicted HTH transcriptional regulator
VTTQLDIFEPRYPAVAGYRRTATSRTAAQQIDPSELRGEILGALKRWGPMTPDEIANVLEADRHNVRSRCSELKRLGLIRSNGTRRTNASGKSAQVLDVII